jgi:hypothetical protein
MQTLSIQSIMKLKRDILENAFDTILLFAKNIREILKRFSDLSTDMCCNGNGRLAENTYLEASKTLIDLDKFEEAEDYANRSLHLEETLYGFQLRMFARINSGNINGAREDYVLVQRQLEKTG